ncbi:hypothetical protein FB382_002458 [Nocardioides ginsengisegetis]|uniref:Uncharacterized protein n=1 Tax=Nocardioides ginsengisegetis TaxID=661491 RepID=A0A7W3J0Q9_9ACTN|nr:hypothetical protein [Nocardioides ginsengisegetis]MBA8804167.1 hypothetical protein [Nocardioides ginsengisegetis]
MLALWQPAGPAAATNCATANLYFAGGVTDFSSATRGARADIQIPTTVPTICTGAADASKFSDAWSMVFAYNPSHSTYYYAQVGFGKDTLTETQNSYLPNARLTSFAQYRKSDGSNWTTAIFAAPTLGSTVTYKNNWRSDDGHIHMLADGVQYLETNYDPTSYWDSSWQGQFENETGYRDTQTWGTLNDKTIWTHVDKSDSSGNWSSFGSMTAVNQGNGAWSVNTFHPASGGWGVMVWTP